MCKQLVVVEDWVWLGFGVRVGLVARCILFVLVRFCHSRTPALKVPKSAMARLVVALVPYQDHLVHYILDKASHPSCIVMFSLPFFSIASPRSRISFCATLQEQERQGEAEGEKNNNEGPIT